MSRRHSISIASILLWMTVIGVAMATLRFSNSVTQTVFSVGCCGIVLGLMQQVFWLRKLEVCQERRALVRLAILWRMLVAVAMTFSYVALGATHQGYLPKGLHGSNTDAWFGTEQLAIASLASGCLCGLLTAPWLRINQLASSPIKFREFVYATIAGVPLVVYAAYEWGTVIGMVDIATQGIVTGLLEPVTVSTGLDRTDISRGNALNAVFVQRSLRAWVGATLALALVSILARNATRSRTIIYGCLLALTLAIPAILLVHWLAIDGYRRFSPHLWMVHRWPSWYALGLAILPLGTVVAILSIRRQHVELPPQESSPSFLCDASVTSLALILTPMICIWEAIRFVIDSGLFQLFSLFSKDSAFMLMLEILASVMLSPSETMLLLAVGMVSLGAMIRRWRQIERPARGLVVLSAHQVPLSLFVVCLVVLVVACTIPFGVSLVHVRI
ncbi:MAG: hypothetical protein AAFX06_18440 [Planctomycetota bacterium]